MQHLVINNGFPWLSLLLLLPLAGALLLPLIGRERPARLLALAVTLGNTLATLPVLHGFVSGSKTFQFMQLHSWIPQLHINYAVGLDGPAAFLLLLITGLMPFAMLALWHTPALHPGPALPCLLMLESAMVGLVIALDFVLFFLFWVAMLMPLYLLLAPAGSETSRRAAARFCLLAMAASAPLLVLGIGLYLENGTFFLPAMMWQACDPNRQLHILLAFLLALMVRTPLGPCHTWLPSVLSGAPPAATFILTALLPGLTLCDLHRFCIPLCPDAFLRLAPNMLYLSAIGTLYGGWAALCQKNLHRLLAHVLICNISLVALGVFSGAAQSLQGSVLHLIHLSLLCTGLCLCLGLLARRGLQPDLEQAAASLARMPRLAACFGLLALAGSALPCTSGFAGALLILSGTGTDRLALQLLAAAGLILAAIALLRLPALALCAPRPAGSDRTADLSLRELLPLAPVLLMMLWLGLAPQGFLAALQPDLSELLQHMQDWQAGQRHSLFP